MDVETLLNVVYAAMGVYGGFANERPSRVCFRVQVEQAIF
jgi:hypothetical protein